jgi:hypothetical protein
MYKNYTGQIFGNRVVIRVGNKTKLGRTTWIAGCRICGGESQTCCHTCNYAKREMSGEEFLAHIERIHAHNIT